MASLKSTLGNDRTAEVLATWPVDIPSEDIVKGDPYPLEDVVKLWFTVKRSYKDTDETAVFQKVHPGPDVTIEGNKASVNVSAEDVTELTPEKDHKLLYEVQVRTVDGKVWTVDDGDWTFEKRLTRSDT